MTPPVALGLGLCITASLTWAIISIAHLRTRFDNTHTPDDTFDVFEDQQ